MNTAPMVPEVFRVYLSKLLLKHSQGISVEKFASYFKQLSKERIKFELFGFGSLSEMFENLSDVCRVVKSAKGTLLYPIAESQQFRNRFRIDKRSSPNPPKSKMESSIRKELTTFGEVIRVRFEGRQYVPTCSLAQLAGFPSDCVLEALKKDHFEIEGLRYLLVGKPEHEKLRLQLALWCPLACSAPNQIHERIALVPLKSCDFILASICPDIPQDNAVRKLRIVSSFTMS